MRKASASTTCSPLPTSPTRRTRLLPSATPGRPARPMMPKLRKTFAPFEAGSPPSPFLWICVLARGRHEVQKRPPRRMFRQGLCYGAGCESPAQHNLRWFFSLKPWKFPDALEILETLAIPCAPGSVHEIHSFPLISQRRICVSIRLRRLYPFRRRQDRESALR